MLWTFCRMFCLKPVQTFSSAWAADYLTRKVREILWCNLNHYTLIILGLLPIAPKWSQPWGVSSPTQGPCAAGGGTKVKRGNRITCTWASHLTPLRCVQGLQRQISGVVPTICSLQVTLYGSVGNRNLDMYWMFRVKASHACGKLRNKSLSTNIPFRFLFFSCLLKNIPNRWQLFHMTGVGRALTRSLGNQLIALVLVPEKLVPLNHHCFKLWVVLAAEMPSVVFCKLFSKTCVCLAPVLCFKWP